MASVKNTVKIKGVGIHSGAPVNVRILPSETPGIFFRRTDIKGAPLIPATWDGVSDATRMNTTIGRGENSVQTIEHLMAALFIMGIDGAIVEIDGPETPIMDGSAAEFIKLIRAAGTAGAPALKKIKVKKTVVAYRKDLIKKLPFARRAMLLLHNLKTGRKEDGFVKLSPARGLEIHAVLDYPDKAIGRQAFDWKGDAAAFIKDIATARTFGRISEWEYLKRRGMGRGASENNVIVLNQDGTGTLNKLHFKDEFVRHKIVDLVGDMFTSGGEIVGRVESVKGSHGLNNEVLRKLFADPENYEIME
ncbi:MAG: UDP-3-O-acyl-N-acetylglucosamine deacetylase [Rickettsiales bacterium]|jgi:UDP-3-O-[3-hydroxymyristoyl] N-acetylglucosamine deacetylase|nr:UDP-3-O-acyl-N-acetylglucosamine deacetylase [Rickettsiales bacterium]